MSNLESRESNIISETNKLPDVKDQVMNFLGEGISVNNQEALRVFVLEKFPGMESYHDIAEALSEVLRDIDIQKQEILRKMFHDFFATHKK